MSLDEIHAAIPHRPPFLLVDEIVEREREADRLPQDVSRGDEWFFAGPLSRAIRWCRACCCAKRPCRPGRFCWRSTIAPVDGGVPVATRMNDVRFKRMVRPGETIEMEVELTERLADALFLKAKVTCGGKLAVRFEFACAVAPMTQTDCNAVADRRCI